MLARIFVSDRYSHGLPIVDVETPEAVDPFIAGWVLNAYFLVAAARSWLVGLSKNDSSCLQAYKYSFCQFYVKSLHLEMLVCKNKLFGCINVA
ncbi:hypothetical protein M5K25_015321 [Dendrobium thyrsiflorum]|uniref:Uncharacterized protein n=1 Tax=Dendrobium thyrsiflorum TaxID=117978 RepID=A0ABD0UPZ2_DENTH